MTMLMRVKYTPSKKAYLNIGCGNIYSSDWNNIDFIKNKDIVRWDIRKGLPYPDSSMDAVYSSHLFEHLSPREARNLMTEIRRVLKTGGIVRTAIPDLQRVCEEYLKCLDNAKKDPSEKNKARYDWVMLELIDQMVREKSGGLMRETLDSGNFDKEYAQSRIGDLAKSGKVKPVVPDSKMIQILKKIKRRIYSIVKSNDPRKTGEVHRWMYDRFSFGRLLESHSFGNISIVDFNSSMIENWNIYNFDASKFDSKKAKKPESLYIEGRKV